MGKGGTWGNFSNVTLPLKKSTQKKDDTPLPMRVFRDLKRRLSDLQLKRIEKIGIRSRGKTKRGKSKKALKGD